MRKGLLLSGFTLIVVLSAAIVVVLPHHEQTTPPATSPIATSAPPSEDPPAATTKVVMVVAVDPAGEAARDFTLAAGSQPVSGCGRSHVSVGTDVVACGPAAAGADVCWVQRDRRTLLCGTDPWDRVLRRVVSDKQVPPVPAAADAQPWALELTNGAHCRVRNGGSWGGRADGYNGAYYCDQKGQYVLVRTGPVVNRDDPLWTVEFGPLGAPDENFPAPAKVGVLTAYFAGSA
ncbi:hypothetical protein ACIRG5_47345 [Lentzea sp. NPDC102401]|uniref:hypothetical protein n=1 Tax=Lentzea sp. NPDC102401 TaxID=3364128 RepID=UPI003806C4CD